MNTDPPFEDPFDEVIARKLAQIVPPAELRSRLLVERPEGTRAPVPVVEASGPARWTWGVAALAAAVVVVFTVVGLNSWERDTGGDYSLSSTSEYFGNFLKSDFSLEMKTGDLPEIQNWYAALHGGEKFLVPESLEKLGTLGCREIDWNGERGALICFRLEDGRLAHLIVLPSRAVENPPGTDPTVARIGAWERSAWSEGGVTYLLFAPSDGAV